MEVFPSPRRGISSGASQFISVLLSDTTSLHQLPPARAAAGAAPHRRGHLASANPLLLGGFAAQPQTSALSWELALEGFWPWKEYIYFVQLSCKEARMEKPNNLFSLVTAEHASASGRAPPPAQLVACIILSYRRGKRYFIPPSCSSLPHSTRALFFCLAWQSFSQVRVGGGERNLLVLKKQRCFHAVVEKALSSG